MKIYALIFFFKESNRVEIPVPRGQLPIRGLLHLFFMIFPLIHPRAVNQAEEAKFDRG